MNHIIKVNGGHVEQRNILINLFKYLHYIRKESLKNEEFSTTKTFHIIQNFSMPWILVM